MIQVEGYPISPQQRKIWHLEGCRNRLRTCCLSELRGELDVDGLKQSLTRLVANHEILRTRLILPSHLKTPIQNVMDSAEFDWRETKLREEDELEALLREIFQAPLTPVDGPSLRVDLIILHPRQNLLLLSMPALLCDGRTIQILQDQIWRGYDPSLSPAQENEEPVQYGQFSQWLHSLAEGDETGRAFWSERRRKRLLLEGASLDKDVAFRPGWIYREPDPALSEKLARASAGLGLDKRAMLWTLWQTLLTRSLEDRAFSIATEFDGRGFDELAESAGPFSRQLPISYQPEPESNFLERCRQVELSLSSAEERQHFFELETRPAFDLLPFVFELIPLLPTRETGGLRVEIKRVISVDSPFLLKLGVHDADRGLALTLFYNAARFSREQADGLLDRLSVLVDAAPWESALPPEAMPLLTPEEKLALLRMLNPLQPQPPATETWISHFEKFAATTPDRVAMVLNEKRVSFGALNGLANHLAIELRARGVRPETLVALQGGRTTTMILAIVAIHKAGGAYLPLDRTLPKTRLISMLRSSGASVWISDRDEAPPLKNLQALPLGRVSRRPQDPANPACPILPDRLAYAIFTSGSTGQPKAVCVAHTQLIHYLRGIEARLRLRENESLALVSTLAADLGHTMSFAALYLGRALHVMSPASITRPESFANYLSSRRVDCIKLTPSHLDALWSPSLPLRALPMRQLILGGETCNPTLLEEVRRSRPELEIHNHYGPTEATVGVLTHRLDEGQNARPLPLGKPLPHARVYLSNPYLRLAPEGKMGEIQIGGATLARGYGGRPEDTASVFCPDPFTDQPGARLYHSGDLGRVNEDGALVFLGRKDDQLKIRGYRVEPAEVQGALNRLPGIRESMVLSGEDGALTAYYLHASLKPEPAPIREALRQYLPDYMLPTHLVPLKAWPLSANGKIDKNALPRPESARAPIVPAGNAVQRELVSIWQETLGKKPIGIRDNFFELGGHSLLMVKLMSAIERGFSKRLPINALLQSPTIEALAASLERETDDTPLIALNQCKSLNTPPLYLIHSIGGQVHWYSELARAMEMRRPVFGLRSPCLSADKESFQDLPTMAAAYNRHLLENRPSGAIFLAGWSVGGVIAFEMARQLVERRPNPPRVRLMLLDSIHWPSIGVPVSMDPMAEWVDFLLDFTAWSGIGAAQWRALLADAAPDEWPSRAAAKLGELGLLSGNRDTEYLFRQFRVYRDNRRAAARYRPVCFNGEALLIRATDSVRRFREAAPDSPLIASYGWDRQLEPAPRVEDIEGDHYSMIRGGAVEKLASLLQSHLEG